MREIELTQGFVALIDDDDYELISQRKWHANIMSNGSVYACAKRYGFKIYMQKFILGLIDVPIQVDHIDSNPLNNQKSNLRRSDQQQNSMNRSKQPNCSSKYKGVYFNSDPRAKKKWRAQIQSNGKTTHLGSHATEEEAAKAYDKAAVEMFGEYAKANF